MKSDLGHILIKLYRAMLLVIGGVLLVFGLMVYVKIDPELKVLESVLKQENDESVERKFENGLHKETGFIRDKGVELVITNCTRCHSSKLVIQNRATREGWQSMIRWMQQTQNLWDLGTNEEPILDYLAKNYAPGKVGRRRNLKIIEWYELK